MLESFRVNTPKPIFVRKIQINTNTKSSFHIKVQIQAFLYLQWLRCPVSDVSFYQEKKAVFMWFCILLHFPPRLVSYALDAWYASFALNISVTVYLAHPALPDIAMSRRRNPVTSHMLKIPPSYCVSWVFLLYLKYIV